MHKAAQYEIERIEMAARNVEYSLADFVLHMRRLEPCERYEHRVAAAVSQVVLAVELAAEAVNKMDH